jgi:2-iminobutanoate/2-iminopropanoate deaminase
MSSSVQGPYSPVIEAGDFVFVSGQIGFADLNTGEEISGIENQTRQCMARIKAILQTSGLSMNNVVKTTVFLKDSKDFSAMNETYRQYFPERKPARSTVVTDLIDPKMLIEIECIACRLPA